MSRRLDALRTRRLGVLRARIDAAVVPCREKDPELFFPVRRSGGGAQAEREYQTQVREAQAACAGCLVRAECLEWALETRQKYGIWGARTPQDRANRAARQPQVVAS